MSNPTSIAQLLDYETNIENCAQAYLAALSTGTQVLTHQTLITAQQKLITPRIEIELIVTGTHPGENDRNTDNAPYRAYKKGMLNFKCWARRNAGGTTLGTLRGQVRQAMLEASAMFNNTAMPWYAVAWYEEDSTRAAIEVSNDEIMTEISYSIHWWVQPDVWPVS